jgi:hypothetical protein
VASIVICPGIHPTAFTQQFLMGVGAVLDRALVFPTDRYPVYSSWHIWQFLQAQPALSVHREILLIGFSAGVVGAAGAINLWQWSGGQVKALIAIDGWGVPLLGDVPFYRMSHDPFTHWSSALLGIGNESFYAEPAVAHLDLWRSPQLIQGWTVRLPQPSSPAVSLHGLDSQPKTYVKMTAAQFIKKILILHQESPSSLK